jgi:hypothetical protein
LSFDNRILLSSVLTISDRVWQSLIHFSLEPAHESLFSLRNIGFRSFYSVYDAQRIIFLQLNKSAFGIQKRIFILTFKNCFPFSYFSFLMKKILAPRSIKLALFKALNLNLFPNFSQNDFFSFRSLSTLLANVFFDGIEFLHPCIRFGYQIIIFLRPNDNEFFVSEKFSQFFYNTLKLDLTCLTFRLFSVNDGFDFLGWNFKVDLNGNFFCVPSFNNYLIFRNKVKYFVNNSNYGSKTKAIKLSPLVFKWRFYHRFCNLKGLKNSLFFLQRHAFKVFNKEVKQDRFSTKRLLDKSFPIITPLNKIFVDSNFFYSFSFYRHCLFFNSYFYCLYCGCFS